MNNYIKYDFELLALMVFEIAWTNNTIIGEFWKVFHAASLTCNTNLAEHFFQYH